MRKIVAKIFNRITITAIIFLFQIWFVVFEVLNLYQYEEIYGLVLALLSLIIAIHILYQDINPAVKLAWIVPIMLFPILGGFLYLLFGHVFIRPKLKKNMEKVIGSVKNNQIQDQSILDEIAIVDENISTQCAYISKYAPAPVYTHSSANYFNDGASYLDSLLDDLRSAEKFIFLEYFIIGLGSMWSQILEILEEKVAEGVEVRVIYDDFGSAMVIPNKYYLVLEKKGIQCVCFNRINPVFSLILNNRDHRKIVVIDGKIGYTGGINISDEYINAKNRFGYWKDSGVRITGNAVWNMTVMFLQMWNISKGTVEDFSKYKYSYEIDSSYNELFDCGYVQPYGDSPLDNELVGENVYLNIINNAKRYLWIYTPYLIIDNVINEALKLACKRGVDVRIITPGIPDKKMVFYMTRSNYKPLIESGARIYEYSPGFIHSKCTLCDDEVVAMGTVNYDYRSFYHHFECGVFLYKTSVTNSLKSDMLETFSVSAEVTPEYLKEKKFNKLAISGPLLHLFAPLL